MAENMDQCPICLEDMDKNNSKTCWTLQCPGEHSFHSKCLIKTITTQLRSSKEPAWAFNGATCPLCRRNILDDSVKISEEVLFDLQRRSNSFSSSPDINDSEVHRNALEMLDGLHIDTANPPIGRFITGPAVNQLMERITTGSEESRRSISLAILATRDLLLGRSSPTSMTAARFTASLPTPPSTSSASIVSIPRSVPTSMGDGLSNAVSSSSDRPTSPISPLEGRGLSGNQAGAPRVLAFDLPRRVVSNTIISESRSGSRSSSRLRSTNDQANDHADSANYSPPERYTAHIGHVERRVGVLNRATVAEWQSFASRRRSINRGRRP